MHKLFDRQARRTLDSIVSIMLTAILVLGSVPFGAVAEELEEIGQQPDGIEQEYLDPAEGEEPSDGIEASLEDESEDPIASIDEGALEEEVEGELPEIVSEEPMDAEVDEADEGPEEAEAVLLRASADDEIIYPDNPVQTIRNPMNTTLDVFDYWVVGQYEPDSQYFDDFGNFVDHDAYMRMYGDNYAESGINQDHPLKFRIWDGDLTGNAQTEGAANVYTGVAPDYAAYHANTMQGIVQSMLGEDGYPVLSDNATVYHPTQGNIPLFNTDIVPLGEEAGTLGYLFDGNDTTGKKAYMDVNGLFQVDADGYYYYNSYENGARLNPQTGEFTVGDAEIMQPNDPNNPDDTDLHTGYWPFGTDVNRHYFGMHLKTEFSQPTNGEVLNPSGVYMPMKFEFRGDDDVWLYLDGVLVGDLGGIHQACTLDIDFQSGLVEVFSVDGAVQQTTLYEIMGGYPGQTDAYGNPMWDGETFAAGSYHTLDFFYMERGNGDSNLEIKFNTISTGDFTAHKSLKRADEDPPLQSGQFEFELLGRAGKYHIDDAPQGYRQYIVDNYATLFSTPSDPDAAPIMPHEQFMPPNAEFIAPDDLPDGVAAGVRTTVVADGNVNFGNYELENSGLTPGDVFLYDIREVVPDDAVKRIDNGDGTFTEVTYADATPTQRAEGGFMKDGVVYTNKVYHYAGYVNTDGHDIWVSKVYLTCDEEAYADGEWVYTGIDSATFANFDNSYKPGVLLRANKRLRNRALEAGQFEFSVFTDEECTEPAIDIYGAPAVAVNAANGSVSFKRIELPEDAIAESALIDGPDGTKYAEIMYYIAETIPADAEYNEQDGTWVKDNITYDATVHPVKVTYTLYPPDPTTGEQVFSVTSEYLADEDEDLAYAQFINESEVLAPYEIELNKELRDSEGAAIPLGGRAFTFTLVEVDENGVDVEDGLVLEATNGADGSIIFDDDAMLFTTADFSEGATEAYRYFRVSEDTTGTEPYTAADGTEYEHVRNGIAYTSETIPVTVKATYSEAAEVPITTEVIYESEYVGYEIRFVKDSDTTGHIEVTTHNFEEGTELAIVSESGPLPTPSTVMVNADGTYSSSTIDFAQAENGEHTYTYTVSGGGYSASLPVHVVKSTEMVGAGIITATWVPDEGNPARGHVHVDLMNALTGYYVNATLTPQSGAPAVGNPSGIGVNGDGPSADQARATRSLDYGTIDFSGVPDGTNTYTYTLSLGSTQLQIPIAVEKSTEYETRTMSISAGTTSWVGDEQTATITVNAPESGTYTLRWGSWSRQTTIAGPVSGGTYNVSISQYDGSKTVELISPSGQSVSFALADGASASRDITVPVDTSVLISGGAAIDDYHENAIITTLEGGSGESRPREVVNNDTFINIQLEEQASLTVTKRVEGRYGDKTRLFPFRLAGLPSGVESLSAIITRSDGTTETVVLTASDLAFELADGDSILFDGLAQGSSLTVIEESDRYYTTTIEAVSLGSGTGVDIDDGARRAAVTNLHGSSEIAYTNTLEEIPATGVNEVFGAYAMLVGAASAGITLTFLLDRRRRREGI